MKNIFTVVFLFIGIYLVQSQSSEPPCSHEVMLKKILQFNPNAITEAEQREIALQKIIQNFKDPNGEQPASTYTIPVVMHVFHHGEEGKMGMEQALSGLEILNQDFNGLNDGWNTIAPEFDSIKGALDITFCLASIDPFGNPTTGVVYYDNENAMYNRGNLFQFAWDNYKYLNIYFPKYVFGEPSNFTAYAYFPSTNGSNANRGGIFYSSIRWGYGDHSELDEGDDWASVSSHEAGHWLDLLHTFSGSCTGDGDLVDDTPPTLGGTIELAGCNNNNGSCGVNTNGENFMDYNHRCKKMFTQGQVERMTAALYLPSRITLWSEDNLIATGCRNLNTSNTNLNDVASLTVFPNPSSNIIHFNSKNQITELRIYNSQGKQIKLLSLQNTSIEVNVEGFPPGIYYFSLLVNGKIEKGKFVVSR